MTGETSWDVTNPDILQSEPLDLSSPDTVPTSVLVKQENNLRELEKLQQDVQEPSSKQTEAALRKVLSAGPGQSKELMTSERSLNDPDSNDEKRAKTRESIRKWRSKQKHEAKDVANKITETREKKKHQDEKIRTLHLKIFQHLSHDQSNSSKELKERIQALHLEIVHHLSQSGSDHVTTSQGSSGKRNIELQREQYSAKAWKAMLEKTRYQERKNKLENNLKELEKLQQDVQELSSKVRQWKQEWIDCALCTIMF